MLRTFLSSLQPEQDSLLPELSRHISDDMLAEIAVADYGQDREQHLAALRLLRDTGMLTEPKHWFPCEVLELVRNLEPDSRPESERVEGHWIRAFVCAALLRAREVPWNYGGDAAAPSFTLIRLINSIEALPVDLPQGTVRPHMDDAAFSSRTGRCTANLLRHRIIVARNSSGRASI